MTTTVATLVAFLRADTSGYVAGTTQAIAADEKLIASQRKVVASAAELGGAMSKYISLPLIAAGVVAVDLAVKFENSFAKIQQAAGLPTAGIKQLQDQVLKLAESTAQTPTSLATTLLQIEKSGVGASQAMNVLTVSAKLATTGLATQQNAASAITSAMNAYTPAVLSAARAGDILTTASQTSKLTVDDLSNSLGRALAPAAALNISFADLVAAEATMSKEGLSASQAGMSLFRIIAAIENPTTKGAEAFQKLGINISQAQAMVKSGNFVGLLKDIAEHAAGNEQAILQLAGGVRGAAGAFAAMAHDGNALTDEQLKIIESTGSLNDLMSAVAKTASVQMKQALVDVEVALIKWGEALTPVVDFLAKIVQKGAEFVSWLSGMNPVLKDAVILFGALLAAAGPLILLGTSLARVWLAYKVLMKGLNEDKAQTIAVNKAQALSEEELAAAVQSEAAAESEAAAAASSRAAARAAAWARQTPESMAELNGGFAMGSFGGPIPGESQWGTPREDVLGAGATGALGAKTEAELAAAEEERLAQQYGQFAGQGGLGYMGAFGGTFTPPAGVNSLGAPVGGGLGAATVKSALGGTTAGIDAAGGAAGAAVPEFAGLIGGLGGLAVAAAAVGIPLIALGREIHNSGAAAREHAQDVATVTKALEGYNTASAAQKNRVQNDLAQRSREAIAAGRAIEPVFMPGQADVPGGRDVAPQVAARSILEDGDKARQKLDSVHEGYENLIKSQGALAAKPAFTTFMAEASRIPAFAGVIAGKFADIGREIAAAFHAATDANNRFAASIGVSATDAASAVGKYDAAIAETTGLDQDTVAAGEKAAIALSHIGIAAGFAAQATQNGMSEVEIAVAGAMAQIDAITSAADATASLGSSLQGLANAEAGPAGGTGGGGGQTAAAKADDQAQKLLAVRDAQIAVQREAGQLQQAETQLAQARLQHKQALEAQRDAEQNYRTVLTGVTGDQKYATEAAARYLEVLHAAAPGSATAATAQTLYNQSLQEAKDDAVAATEATLQYKQAQNDAASAALNLRDANRALAHAKNDAPLAGFAVADAKRQLAIDQAGGGTLHYVQTPTGSKMEGDGGLTGAAKAEQIAKDQIALRDAEIDAGAAADQVKKAQLGVSDATINLKQKTIDLAAAHKLEKETLDGYATSTKQAIDATEGLTSANLTVESSAQGVVTAMQGIQDAQNAVATNEVNLHHALDDLQGKLTTAGGAANNFKTHAQDVATAAAQAHDAIKQWATDQANLSGNAPKTYGWALAYVQALQNLKDFLKPTGDLAVFMDMMIQKIQAAANVAIAGQKNTSIWSGAPSWWNKKGPGQALGGPVSPGIEYWVGENGPERFVPSTMGTIVPGGAAGASGGSGGSTESHTTIVNHHYAIYASALDAQSVGPVVVEALREETRNNGGLYGVRTLS